MLWKLYTLLSTVMQKHVFFAGQVLCPERHLLLCDIVVW